MPLDRAARRFIERHRLARLAFATAEGLPAIVPAHFALDTAVDDVLYAVAAPPAPAAYLPRTALDVALLVDDVDEVRGRSAGVVIRAHAAPCATEAEFLAAMSALGTRYPDWSVAPAEGAPLLRLRIERLEAWGRLEAPGAGSADTAGLQLVRTVERISAPHVTTEHRAGVSSGAIARLRRAGDDMVEEPIESFDEAAMPDEGGRMLRYPLDHLDDGLYVADSVGPANTLRRTFFEVVDGRIGRLFDDRRRALRELRHLER
ncbi:MAG: pyridoxamine 5'-phosphate oxidase family protein [Dehalococcoidia bacterium]